MNLGHCISRLLQENETVILPGLGAFITVHKAAEIDKKSKQISPPSKQISFNQKIRNNDGLLIGFIAESEKISHFEALQQIEKERERILYQIDKGEKIILEGIGTLFYDEDSNIQFEPIEKENQFLESFGLEAVTVNEIPETYISDESKSAVIEMAEPQDNAPLEPEVVPAEKLNDWKKQVPEKEKKRSWVWLFFIVIPLIAAGIYMLLIQKKENLNTTKIKLEKPLLQEPMKINVIKSDSAKNDSVLITEEEKITEQKDSVPNTISTNISAETKYYLVSGSFKEEENAEKYLQELKEKGYEPFHLGKKGNFFLIGINIYNSEREALKEQQLFLENNEGSGAWVYEE